MVVDTVVGNRKTKVQEWYRGLAYLKSIFKSRMIGGTKMYEVLEILSSIRGGAKDVIDVPFVQGWLSSLIFFKHFSLDVTNKQARIVGLTVLQVQIVTAKEALQKLNQLENEYVVLSSLQGRVCNNFWSCFMRKNKTKEPKRAIFSSNHFHCY